MEVLLIIIGVLFLLGFFILYSTFSWGLVTYKFWYWFLLPIFPELPLLNFWQAVGIMFFISLFKSHSGEGIKSEYKDTTSHTISVLLAPWFTLLIGYLINILFIV